MHRHPRQHQKAPSTQAHTHPRQHKTSTKSYKDFICNNPLKHHLHQHKTTSTKPHKDLFPFLLVLLCPLQEIQVALPGSGTAAARAALSIPVSVCSIFVFRQRCGCQCLGFLTCTQTLMHAIAHRGCKHT